MPKTSPDSPAEKILRRGLVQAAVFLAVMGILFGLGLAGRNRARVEGEIQKLEETADLLQLILDDEQSLTAEILDGSTNSVTKPSAELAELTRRLDAHIAAVEKQLKISQFDEPELLKLRIFKATAANAQRGFADSVKILPGSTVADRNLEARILRAQADALYGTRQWRSALDAYSKAFAVTTNGLALLGRVADCQQALGMTNEAFASYHSLARRHLAKGVERLGYGKADFALGHYGTAIALLTHFVEKKARNEAAPDLAGAHELRGNAHLFQGRADAAIADFNATIRLRTALNNPTNLASAMEKRGSAFFLARKLEPAAADFEKAIELRSGSEGDLAPLYQHRANLALARGKHDVAIGDYNKVIQIREKNPGLDLARALNNRAVAFRAQNKIDKAIRDFEKALLILSGANVVVNDTFSGAAVLEISMGYASASLEALVRTRLAGRGGARETSILVGMVEKNRADAALASGKNEVAMDHLRKAIERFSGIVERESERDLLPQLEKARASLASLQGPVKSR